MDPRVGLDVIKKKTPAPIGNRTPDRPIRIIVAVPTSLVTGNEAFIKRTGEHLLPAWKRT